jgi:hypothetical protein
MNVDGVEPQTEEIGIKTIATAKISTSFHGSPCDFKQVLKFSRGPQNFKQIFT